VAGGALDRASRPGSVAAAREETPLTPDAFIAKWKLSTLNESQAAQPHFLDLCRLLGEPEPVDPPDYCFEREAQKTSGRRGFADVFKRGHFAWEYKGKGANLNDALAQLQQYALALHNPPLLVACDLERFLIVTNWTNTVSRRIELRLDDLRDARHRETLRWVLSDPERLKPGLTRKQITTERAIRLAELARDLRAKGLHPERVAKFLVRLVFGMFAEDVGLLRNREIQKMLEAAERRPDRCEALAEKLFKTMGTGGDLDFTEVLHFDGGLFDAASGEPMGLPMDRPQIRLALDAARQDWSEIEPAIMGTLFVQGLDPRRMADLFRFAGAKGFGSVTFRKRFEQYTDRDKIMKIVEPVILRPLLAEWAGVKAAIAAKLGENGNPRQAARAKEEARALYQGFLDRLGRFKVLDPACGSGNFLFLALHTLKDVELLAIVEAEAMGLDRELYLRVGPAQMLGIEINPFAVEIAKASVWIGDLQWRRKHGFAIDKEPILRPLDTIECRDALIDADGREASWPEADVIVSNPPFLGGKRLRTDLGDAPVDRLFAVYNGRVPREADLVCYWFAKSSEAIAAGRAARAGLVCTNSIRGGANRVVLDRIREQQVIFDAWDDEEWTLEGVAVRVSMVCFADSADWMALPARLDGLPVHSILSDLTPGTAAGSNDLTMVSRQVENLGIAVQGLKKVGPFDVPGVLARKWLQMPRNPDGSTNDEVLFPLHNGIDVVRRARDTWIIDFDDFDEVKASFFEGPFEHVARHVRPMRSTNRDRQRRERWWRLGRSGVELRDVVAHRSRYIATPEVSKHRLFVFRDRIVAPDSQLMVIGRDDDTIFGILHAHAHELWSLRLGTSLEDRPRYTPTTCFETFPFPEGLTPNLPAASYADDPRARAIADVARRLDDAREAWLNPEGLVRREPEVVPGYPDRILPVSEEAAKELKKRTLTNLYNRRPAWLDALHRELDAAVAAAYGWPADLSDQEILQRLFELNQERAAAGR
jgi:type II restriction/modification system DNA methylase subunit YeeA